MYRNISGVRFTVSFLALLLVVVLSACSSAPVKPSAEPLQNTTATTTPLDVAPAPVTPAPVAPTPVISAVAPKAATGTFHERVSYDTPQSSEDVDFVFTIDAGIVKNLVLDSVPVESNSRKFQKKFMDGITSQIVGKKISEIGTFDRVGGASLTTPAFNQAVAKLKAQS